MTCETITCPHCQGSGKLVTKAAKDLVPGDVLLLAEPEQLLTIRSIIGEGEDRLTFVGTNERGEDVRYHGMSRTHHLPVAKKIPAGA